MVEPTAINEMIGGSQRRRLVINIGGAKILVSNIGGQTFRENIHSKKFLFKSPIIKISDDFFLVIDNFFSKNYTLHSKFAPFSLYFLSLSLFLLFFMFFLNKKNKNSRLIIGGGKKGFCPHLNYLGRVPGLPPRVYAYGGSNHFLKVLNLDILRLCSIQSVHVRIFLASTKVVCPFSDTPSLQICSIL